LKQLFKSEDGRVIGVHHKTAERNGKRLDVGCCIAFEVKNSRIMDRKERLFDLHACDEFWS